MAAMGKNMFQTTTQFQAGTPGRWASMATEGLPSAYVNIFPLNMVIFHCYVPKGKSLFAITSNIPWTLTSQVLFPLIFSLETAFN